MYSVPDSLNIFATNRCNLSCRYCFVDKRYSTSPTVNVAAIKRTINWFLSLSGEKKTITFIGGEPLLEFKKLKNIIVFIRNNRVKKKQRYH